MCRFLRRTKLSKYRKSFVSCELRTSAVYSRNEVEKSTIKSGLVPRRLDYRSNGSSIRSIVIPVRAEMRPRRIAGITFDAERASGCHHQLEGDTCREVAKEDVVLAFNDLVLSSGRAERESSDAMEIKRRLVLDEDEAFDASSLLRLPRDVIDSIGTDVRGISQSTFFAR